MLGVWQKPPNSFYNIIIVVKWWSKVWDVIILFTVSVREIFAFVSSPMHRCRHRGDGMQNASPLHVAVICIMYTWCHKWEEWKFGKITPQWKNYECAWNVEHWLLTTYIDFFQFIFAKTLLTFFNICSMKIQNNRTWNCNLCKSDR